MGIKLKHQSIGLAQMIVNRKAGKMITTQPNELLVFSSDGFEAFRCAKPPVFQFGKIIERNLPQSDMVTPCKSTSRDCFTKRVS